MSSRHAHLVAAVSGLRFGLGPAVINGARIFLRQELAEIRDTIAEEAGTLRELFARRLRPPLAIGVNVIIGCVRP